MRQTSVTDRHILRVYNIYRSVHLRISVESRRRIYLERRTDYQKDVSSLHGIDCLLDLRHGLTEPYDVRTELSSVRSEVSDMNLISTYVEDSLLRIAVAIVAAVLRTHLVSSP